MVESLAHALVFERVFAFHAGIQQLIALLIHAKENGTQLRALHGAGVGAGVHTRHVLHGDGLHHIDFTGNQRRNARCIVGNRGVNHLGHIAINLAPIVTVAAESGFHAGLALAHTEWTCSIGAKRRCVFNAFTAINGLGGLISLAPFFTHDVHERNHFGQDREGCFGDKFHREIIDLADFSHIVGIALHI